ncbi:MAG: tetratricopeptide repeat protein [Endomicrobia bacterium]|nr:tetratricopeptide repeat protein [Endomicrobiia bacterium]MCL2507089.1 tetratricopeptide repeat protein [Endomicrobiia bacterium]
MKKLFISLIFFFSAFVFASASSGGLEKALILLNDGKTDEAMDIVSLKLKSETVSADAYMAMGLIQLDKKNYSQAKENFEQALRINKKIVAAHYMLAMIYEKEGNDELAIDKWQRILKHAKDVNLRALAEKHIKQLKGQLE